LRYKVTVVIRKTKDSPKTTIDFTFTYLSAMQRLFTEWLEHADKKTLEIIIEGFDC